MQPYVLKKGSREAVVEVKDESKSDDVQRSAQNVLVALDRKEFKVMHMLLWLYMHKAWLAISSSVHI